MGQKGSRSERNSVTNNVGTRERNRSTAARSTPLQPHSSTGSSSASNNSRSLQGHSSKDARHGPLSSTSNPSETRSSSTKQSYTGSSQGHSSKDPRHGPFSSTSNPSTSSSSSKQSGFKEGRLTFPCTNSRHSNLRTTHENAPEVPTKFTRLPKELWDDSALPIRVDSLRILDKNVGFTEKERTLLLAFWHHVERHTKNFSIKYYVSLITLHPEFRDKFGVSNTVDAHVQAHAISTLRYLTDLANNIDDQDAFNSSISKLADRHKTLDFNKEDLNVINNVFLNIAIKELPDLMFPESAYVLIMFLSTVTTRLFERMKVLKVGGKKKQETDGNPHGFLRRSLMSNSDEVFETITEWQNQVIQLHYKRNEEDRSRRGFLRSASKSLMSLIDKLKKQC